ncbi:hypothetical protein ACHAWF_014730 [Thalassiosira exigua]
MIGRRSKIPNDSPSKPEKFEMRILAEEEGAREVARDATREDPPRLRRKRRTQALPASNDGSLLQHLLGGTEADPSQHGVVLDVNLNLNVVDGEEEEAAATTEATAIADAETTVVAVEATDASEGTADGADTTDATATTDTEPTPYLVSFATPAPIPAPAPSPAPAPAITPFPVSSSASDVPTPVGHTPFPVPLSLMPPEEELDLAMSVSLVEGAFGMSVPPLEQAWADEVDGMVQTVGQGAGASTSDSAGYDSLTYEHVGPASGQSSSQSSGQSSGQASGQSSGQSSGEVTESSYLTVPSPTPDDSSSSSDKAWISGPVIGSALAAVALSILAVVAVRARKDKKRRREAQIRRGVTGGEDAVEPAPIMYGNDNVPDENVDDMSAIPMSKFGNAIPEDDSDVLVKTDDSNDAGAGAGNPLQGALDWASSFMTDATPVASNMTPGRATEGAKVQETIEEDEENEV